MAKRVTTKRSRPGTRPNFSAGERAFVRFGSSAMPVEIVEDRGPVGAEGRRLMRVRIVERDGEVQTDSTFEVAADELMPVNVCD